MPTLCCASENIFQRIHRPHPELTLKQIFAGLKQLRAEYKGQLWLEVLLLAGINDTQEELAELKNWIEELEPEKIQLNTVVRPPAEAQARALDSQGLEKIKIFLGPRAEIVAEHFASASGRKGNCRQGGLLAMIHRRPLRQQDMIRALGITPEEVQQLIKGLLIKGLVEKKKQGEEIYYVSRSDRQNHKFQVDKE
jgi:wyosine [tRNA(Phe)-imidazoG37] synthetase (radical SAM superfamily)